MPEPPIDSAACVPRRPAMLPELYRVRDTIAETADVVTLRLVRDDGAQTPLFAPGQFNMLYAFGTGEVPISLSGDPDDRSQLVHTIRRVGMVSSALARLEPGATLGVRGPFGTPWPDTAAPGEDVLIVAGGIGLLPLRPLVYRIARHRRRYGRVTLLYGGRRPVDLVFGADLARWQQHDAIAVHRTVDFADNDWPGAVGTVMTLLERITVDPERLTAYVCGPEVMMRRTIVEVSNRGLPPQRIFLSLERNMKCAIGLCGHCQLGSQFVCRDGAVFDYRQAAPLLKVPEL